MTANRMREINAYGKELTPEEIERGVHRDFVGGMWNDIGALQFAFMKNQDLQPHHRLIDVGCGTLRGGVHFIRYLKVGHYCGLDVNASLIEAGKKELGNESLMDKEPRLLVNDKI